MIKFLGIIVVFFGVFLVYVGLKPSDMFIVREIFIHGSPEAIFPYINNSQKANEWMPWREVDPSVVMSYSGPDGGVGSVSSWVSSGRMGTGQAMVIESIPNRLVKTQLSYTKPMQMSQLAEVSLTPTAEGTVVRWSVRGKNGFVSKLMCVFMNLDKVVGGQFEKGLFNLKGIIEGGLD